MHPPCASLEANMPVQPRTAQCPYQQHCTGIQERTLPRQCYALCEIAAAMDAAEGR